MLDGGMKLVRYLRSLDTKPKILIFAAIIGGSLFLVQNSYVWWAIQLAAGWALFWEEKDSE